MKIFDFDYTKKEGSTSRRKAIALHASDGWVDAVDLTKLTESEQEEAMSIQLEYERKMKPFMEKAFRRFHKEGIQIIHEETKKE